MRNTDDKGGSDDCEDVVRRYINVTIDSALHQRFHHGATGTLEEICVRIWEGSLGDEMVPLLRRTIEERGYVGEAGTPPPGSPHEHSYHVKKRRSH